MNEIQKMPFERAIGRLAMNFGALEVRLAATVEDLVSDQPGVGRAVISGRLFDALVTLFTELVAAKTDGPAENRRAVELAMQLRELSGLRNKVLHAAWLDKNGTDIHAVKTRFNREKGKGVERPMTPAEIDEIAARVHRVSEEFRDFGAHLRNTSIAADHSDAEDASEYLSGATPAANTIAPVVLSGRIPK